MDRYAVFGNPIKHSKSPEIHSRFAEQTKQVIQYDKQLVEVDEFERAASQFFSEGGKGLNVTVPFKEDAYRYAHQLTERAQAAEAVNTLALQSDGTILGDNTDGAGLVFDIKERLKWSIQGLDILILGAGGAVKGVLLPLLLESPNSITVANRTASKAQDLAQKFSAKGSIQGCGFSDIQDHAFDLIINGTSASLGGDVPPVSPRCVGESTCVYDMVYGDELTPFLKWSQSKGANQVADGLGMLLCQAAESFFIWRGVRPLVDESTKNK